MPETIRDWTRRAASVAVARVRDLGWLPVQAAVAAAGSWLIASQLLHHRQAFFAPIAAVIVFGTTRGQELSRAIEVTVGVSIGAEIAALIGFLIPAEELRILIVVALVITLAQAAGAGPLFVAQASVSAIFVAALPSAEGVIPQRFFDALVGGVVALVMGHVLFPVHPLALVSERAGPMFDRLANVLDMLADALASGDRAKAEHALRRTRVLDQRVHEVEAALSIGYRVSRFAPVRRGALPYLEPWERALTQIDYAARGVRVLARAILTLLRSGQPPPPEITAAVRKLADAVRALGEQLPAPRRRDGRERQEATREAALHAAGQAVGVFERQEELALAMVIGQIRATALDLLRGSGMETAAAVDAIEEVTGPIVPLARDGDDGPDRRHRRAES